MDENSIGVKILALRKQKGVTQADLGQYLNISYQAVSKWERGESLPDFDTLSKIARYFNVPITYFENNADDEEDEEASVGGKREMLGVCKDCGKVLYSGDAGLEVPHLVCKPCVDRRRVAAKAKEAEQKRQEAKKKEQARIERLMKEDEIKRERNKGLIWAAVAAALLIVGIFIAAFQENPVYQPWEMIVYGLIGVIIFVYPFVAQLFWYGVVMDVLECGGRIIGTPGIIWEFSWDGFWFLIGMKILFALLRFIVWLLSYIFFGLIAMIISPVTFFIDIPKLSDIA